MKYVWASWENKTVQQMLTGNINSLRTRYIRGYGCAVTFSSPIMEWRHTLSTSPENLKFYEPSICRP